MSAAASAQVTTTTVIASANPSVTGQSVTLSATVDEFNGRTPPGTVVFTGPGGLNETVPLSDGRASITTTALVTGTITAAYGGSGPYNPSSGTVFVTVNPAGTTTTLSASPNPAVPDEVVTISVMVAVNLPGSGTPTGTVTFTGPGGLNQTVPLAGGGASITTAALAAGTVTATYSGDASFGASSGTLALAITRPDPSLDPEVTGLVTAQVDAAKRLARDQARNFHSRLEQLHDEGDRRRNSMDVRLGYAEAQDDPGADAAVVGAHRAADAVAGVDTASSPDGSSSGGLDFGPYAAWAGGFVNFGERDGRGVEIDHTTVGVSAGIDYRFSEAFVAGFGLGYGRDESDVGGNGTESRADAYSAAVYGSYKLVDSLYLDALLGGSWLDFDSQRFVPATGDFATGSRDGRQVFGSLTAAYELRHDAWLASPYGRIEFSRSWLDGYSEAGSDLALTYGDQSVDTFSGVLGLRAKYSMTMDWATLIFGVRAEYAHDFEGSSRVALGYSDLAGLPFAVETGSSGRDHATLGLSLDAELPDAWMIGTEVRTGFARDTRDHAVGVKLQKRF